MENRLTRFPNRLNWFNYKIAEYEYIETPVNFVDYIPQIGAAQSLYNLYLQMGDQPIEAARKVLEACVGKNGSCGRAVTNDQ